MLPLPLRTAKRHVGDGFDAKAVPVCQIADDLLTLGSE